ncbi:uncharacterized protein JN550_003525 [Neoarthrinium moseri]|uniref:uncharacterized protein n=1 Tax=Neoarthrinium moseri TaxID=1658444 RepID=UPI001FDC451E|nr:uncharacterized protein JN550_003525 [Neoarthrinium moseri]KAI1873272.1 hypothetical protein JN550_003525 [Neoarthrinium moseri]
MCGIHAIISSRDVQEIPHSLKQSLSNRGPDYLGQATRTVSGESQIDGDISLFFTSTVLALRGDHIAQQPIEHADTGSILCWNGEAWKLAGQPVNGNDGEAIFAQLMSASLADTQFQKNHVLQVLRSIQGPFAFLFYDAVGKCLYFGRDRLGRRSLLTKRAADGSTVIFSSIAGSSEPGWKEVDADGIFSVHLTASENGSLNAMRDDWLASGETDLVSSIGRFNMSPPEGGEAILDFNTPSVKLVQDYLTRALELRVLNVPEPPRIPGPLADIDVRVAVLFSGGLDCTLMARLAHDVLPASQGIDLINVAFQSARDAAGQPDGSDGKSSQAYEACPDRITGRQAFAELKTACPSRWWRFIAVNIPFAETMAHRSRVVSLMYPHNTEMDLSISLALYFASRGIGDGYVAGSSGITPAPSVTTPARVLLSGLGADELFGGYSRHEAAFKRTGYAGLADELKLDVSRIGQRNLGRDDRILSHWGKEVRFPFLDEDLIKFAIECPVWHKCDFAYPFHPAVIDPAKRLLRLLADQLNLPLTAREKKRASSIAHVFDKAREPTGKSSFNLPGSPKCRCRRRSEPAACNTSRYVTEHLRMPDCMGQQGIASKDKAKGFKAARGEVQGLIARDITRPSGSVWSWRYLHSFHQMLTHQALRVPERIERADRVGGTSFRLAACECRVFTCRHAEALDVGVWPRFVDNVRTWTGIPAGPRWGLVEARLFLNRCRAILTILIIPT